ncbi:MAG: YARHG domain-containing protein [Variibacter sp.]|nr:YARHG domain-containing protein [Variibacter sp.]
MRRGAGVLMAMLIGGAMMAPPAQAQSCHDLWVAINSIYQSYGYCFQTARARNYFGNAGCRTSSMQAVRNAMSSADRGRINRLVRLSQQLGCRD